MSKNDDHQVEMSIKSTQMVNVDPDINARTQSKTNTEQGGDQVFRLADIESPARIGAHEQLVSCQSMWALV
jgi:hypothetical protein